jgi:riboflavin synthase alpha subunit
MFTGIIEELGEITAWEQTGDAARLTVRAPLAVSDAGHGDSISVSGVCLTVVDQGPDWFTADVMAETIAMSTLGAAKPGHRVNLERATQVGDRLGGHIVQGHIDGTATVLAITPGSAGSPRVRTPCPGRDRTAVTLPPCAAKAVAKRAARATRRSLFFSSCDARRRRRRQ